MKEGINYYSNQINPKTVLEYLSNEERLTLSEFSQAFHFFLRLVEKDDLTIDEKCLMAIYLYYIDVDIPPNKHHTCAGKKNQLCQYYFLHHSECQDETIIEISKYFKIISEKKIKKENICEEKYLEQSNPALYQEMVKLREYKEKKKIKSRKHS